MAAFDPWGNDLDYDPERDEAAERLANLSDAELVELFGTRPTVELSDIPPEVLASPTLGAIRRAQGITEDPADPFAHMLPGRASRSPGRWARKHSGAPC
jgi:hypothetical protein